MIDIIVRTLIYVIIVIEMITRVRIEAFSTKV